MSLKVQNPPPPPPPLPLPLPPPPPTIRNVEEWISFYARQNGYSMMNEIETTRVPNFRYGYPMLTLEDGRPYPINGKPALKTPDDGTCLIHSILTSLSPSYCKLSYHEKRIIGNLYRDEIKNLDVFNENEKDLIAEHNDKKGVALPNDVATKLADVLHP